MNIQNKKINFLGDSITQGCGVSCTEHIFTNILKEDVFSCSSEKLWTLGNKNCKTKESDQ